MAIWVDGEPVATSCIVEQEDVVVELWKSFEVKDLGKSKVLLGMEAQ
jgi:hypothetical protein